MKIFNYSDFIFESSDVTFPFFYSKAFEENLSRIDSPISDIILDMKLTPTKISMIDIGSADDTVRFVQSNRLVDYFDSNDKEKWYKFLRSIKSTDEIWTKNSSEMKIGRFIRRVVGGDIKDSEIEEFVNKWKSIKEGGMFELWDSSMIEDAYNSTKYSQNGPSSNPLINSCMNDQFEFVSYYKYSSAKVLVLLDDDGYISGRALVWTDHMGKKIMDRVYYIWDSDYHKFTSYAMKKGWYYKTRNISGGSSFTNKEGKQVSLHSKVKVPNCWNMMDYNEFPYMDTFYYTTGEVAMNYEPDGEYLKLQDTDGGYEHQTNLYDIHGNHISDMDDYVESETQGGYLYIPTAVHVRYDGGGYSGYELDDYIEKDYLENPKNGFVKAIDGKWYRETHCVWSDKENSWIFRPDAIYDKGDWIWWDNFHPGGNNI